MVTKLQLYTEKSGAGLNKTKFNLPSVGAKIPMHMLYLNRMKAINRLTRAFQTLCFTRPYVIVLNLRLSKTNFAITPIGMCAIKQLQQNRNSAHLSTFESKCIVQMHHAEDSETAHFFGSILKLLQKVPNISPHLCEY